MSDGVLGDALSAAAFAGIVAVGVTVAIERWGGQLGGLIGTLPTTIVPASLGIWAQSADPEAFAAAMDGVPGGMLIDALFLWLWRVLPPRLPALTMGATVGLMSAVSLTVWLAAAVAFVAASGAWLEAGHGSAVLGVAGLGLLLVVGVLACLRRPPSPGGRARVSALVLVLRGVFAAAAIGVTVWIASQGGAVAAGVAAVFPAIFLTTMVSLWVAQGQAVPIGAVGPMMLGSASVAAFALFAGVLFAPLGPALGAAAAWALAVVTTTVPAWAWLGRGAKVGEPG